MLLITIIVYYSCLVRVEKHESNIRLDISNTKCTGNVRKVHFVNRRLEWTPKPLHADAGLESFSEGRAMRHISYLSETIGDHQVNIRDRGWCNGLKGRTGLERGRLGQNWLH